MRQIKLIWDFRGEDALKTAQHHAIHLKEFSQKADLPNTKPNHEKLTEFHSIATMEVNETVVFAIRDVLKPHRAEIVE